MDEERILSANGYVIINGFINGFGEGISINEGIELIEFVTNKEVL
ncbi:TPA: hypothetical protein ACGXMH_001366 [Bacillus mobilis]|nr:hypothetical protein [Bacillus mobilis]MED4385024.1 hypothetical protein [Bacillus mobilis]